MTYPENTAEETWKNANGVQFSLVKTRMGHYCGYCRFVERPVREQEYSGILTYVPVHGGITWAKENEDGMVYGFDCDHLGDDSNFLLWNKAWLRAECERMATAILIAADYEDGYLLAETNEEKAEILDAFHQECEKKGIEFVLQDSYLAMVKVLSGSL